MDRGDVKQEQLIAIIVVMNSQNLYIEKHQLKGWGEGLG